MYYLVDYGMCVDEKSWIAYGETFDFYAEAVAEDMIRERRVIKCDAVYKGFALDYIDHHNDDEEPYWTMYRIDEFVERASASLTYGETCEDLIEIIDEHYN